MFLIDEINLNKFMIENDGIFIKVRGDLGGWLWKRILDLDGIFWKESDICVIFFLM